MCDDEIHVGDVVKVRSWDDMAREFVVDSCGDIDFGPAKPEFVRNMRELCGREVTITNMCTVNGIAIFSVNSGRHETWNFVSEMFEPAADYYEIIKSGFDLNGLF